MDDSSLSRQVFFSVMVHGLLAVLDTLYYKYHCMMGNRTVFNVLHILSCFGLHHTLIGWSPLSEQCPASERRTSRVQFAATWQTVPVSAVTDDCLRFMRANLQELLELFGFIHTVGSEA